MSAAYQCDACGRFVPIGGELPGRKHVATHPKRGSKELCPRCYEDLVGFWGELMDRKFKKKKQAAQQTVDKYDIATGKMRDGRHLTY